MLRLHFLVHQYVAARESCVRRGHIFVTFFRRRDIVRHPRKVGPACSIAAQSASVSQQVHASQYHWQLFCAIIVKVSKRRKTGRQRSPVPSQPVVQARVIRRSYSSYRPASLMICGEWVLRGGIYRCVISQGFCCANASASLYVKPFGLFAARIRL